MPPLLTPAALCEAIRRGDDSAPEQLYTELQSVKHGVWFFIKRQCPQDAEDLLNETWMEVVKRIKANEVEHPEKVFAYAQGVAKRLVLQKLKELERVSERLAA